MKTLEHLKEEAERASSFPALVHVVVALIDYLIAKEKQNARQQSK